MLREVSLPEFTQKEKFLSFATLEQRREILELAEELKGKRVLHLNATAHGGGVAEILKSLVPYSRSIGIDASWYVIDGEKVPERFFSFTNNLHNALQGYKVEFDATDWALYEEVNAGIARTLEEIDYDILLVHDPQPLPAVYFLERRKQRTLFVHIDTTSPVPSVWEKIVPFMLQYDHVVFSNKEFVNVQLQERADVKIFAPAIDPLSLKQHVVSKQEAREYVALHDVPEKGPLIVQISRFDIWKNPFGVIEAFQEVQKNYPDATLALVGLKEAKDNPEAEKVFKEVQKMASGNSRIMLFFEAGTISNIPEFTMMMQNAADVVIQNSTREGFGLTVTEAMWKGKVVLGGPASGIKKQISSGTNGFIVENAEQLAERIRYVLSHEKEVSEIGRAARESVRKNFLMPRLLLDHLHLYQKAL